MFLAREIVGSLRAGGSLLAQGKVTPADRTPIQDFLSSPFLLLGGMMALFYVIVLAPEKRRKAAEKNKLSALQKNDRIVTIGGIHGVVSSIGEADTITIRLDENGTTKMKIDRTAVARILSDSAESSEKKPN